MTKIKVTIIDVSSDSDRRKGLISSLHRIAEIQVYYRNPSGMIIIDTSYEKDVKYLKPSLFTLVHSTNKEILNEKTSALNNLNKKEDIVFYSGDGMDGLECPDHAKEQIYRPITGKTGKLSREETTDLVNYFLIPSSKRSENDRPQILRKPVSYEVLPALSILCQAYLALHAKKEKIKWHPPEIEESLELMKWAKFSDSEMGISFFQTIDLENKKEKISNTKQWQDILRITKDEFEEKIKLEWNINDINECPLKDFIDSIYKLSTLKAKDVAEAYIQIVNKIGNKS